VKVISLNSELDPHKIFPFELDDFQQDAIAVLNQGKSVVVCAPTGSGKTLVGEYAIYLALHQGKRVFYTTPLKALSNQKYRDFLAQFGKGLSSPLVGGRAGTPRQENPQLVGLITGDILINPNAKIVVMTTEIFRNMLYETPIGEVGTSLEDVAAVVLDECHYLSDRGRGTVWEESIIYCPPQIQLVALSATIGNSEEFTEWINRVRTATVTKTEPTQTNCELINSDFRPVPLRFYFSHKKGLFPLLNSQQTKLNPKLKAGDRNKGNNRRLKNKECPNLIQTIQQLQERDMLPAIYIIFSRRGCDRAVENLDTLNLVSPKEAQQIEAILLQFVVGDNPELQQILLQTLEQTNSRLKSLLFEYLASNPDASVQLWNYFADHPNEKYLLFQLLAELSQVFRIEQIEPLIRGIASHHAGLLPVWKELVERLFELGLVKIVFATATLAAGINMPARTTVISALSKRTDDGHSMLTPSEFLQIAGRAGRRGKDEVGYVVTVQTPFEGAKEAAYLATSQSEPLRSWFTPSYGMVLNLLQKHTLAEVKELLERSFAEYLARKKLAPEQEAIAFYTTELTKIDVELAPIPVGQFTSYEKLRERLKEEHRLLEILQQQAEAVRKKELKPLIPALQPGQIVGLKGKHVQVSSPLAAVVITKIHGSGQAPNLVCLGIDNCWYVVANADLAEINQGSLPLDRINFIDLPVLDQVRLGKLQTGEQATVVICKQIENNLIPAIAPAEVVEQQQKIDRLQSQLDRHPLQQWENPGQLVKRHKQRIELREKLHKTQIQYQRNKSNQSYYWDEFLNLIKVLREFQALEGYEPTELGKAAATIRGDNELWLALAFMSGELELLEPHHLAAAVCALITETPRGDVWCDFPPPPEVLEALGIKKRQANQGIKTSILREIRPHLFQTQHRYGVGFPIWREYELVGLAEQWALGIEWNELCESTSLDEGDIVRMLRRTLDVLWQIPQIPYVSSILVDNAQEAIAQMKRFPI
jgi:superfamily II RNA helicase